MEFWKRYNEIMDFYNKNNIFNNEIMKERKKQKIEFYQNLNEYHFIR